MATTPPTSISSSYQRLGGPTPVITQGTPGPELSAATRERLALAEQRKLEEERRLAEERKKSEALRKMAEDYQRREAEKMKNMSPFQRGEYLGKRGQAQIEEQREEQRGLITGMGRRPNF